MQSKDILYSKGNNDECLTPGYAVKPICFTNSLSHLSNGHHTTASRGMNLRIGLTNKVVRSHISEGKDFYNYEPEEHWDVIVSNPPFTNKRKIFERALSFEKPFALIMSLTWMNDSAPKQLFKDKDLQLLMFDKRIKFSNNGIVQNKITFSSAYYCWNFLPKQIIMEGLSV